MMVLGKRKNGLILKSSGKKLDYSYSLAGPIFNFKERLK